MDELDKQILMEIEGQSIQASLSLADHFGISERTMRRRITNLLNTKMAKTVVVPNFLLLGFRYWSQVILSLLAK